ncbi:hypothetical protein PQX77_018874 [Marasmius sp. AFHP31]|nr:hypothetical protein PQX77_018874 [Marasmius sp. AFHP31]
MSLKDFALRKTLRREAEEAQAAAKVASESTPANPVNETREKESASGGEAVKEPRSDVNVVDAGAEENTLEKRKEVPAVSDITQRSSPPPVPVIPVLAIENRPQSEEPMEVEVVPGTVVAKEEVGEVAPELEAVESSDDARDPPELVPQMPGMERSRSRMDLNSLLSPAPTTQSPPVPKTPEPPTDNLNLNVAVNGTTSAAADVDMESSPVVDASPSSPPPLQAEPPVLSIATTTASVSTQTKSTPPSDSAVIASSTASTRASTPGPTPTTPTTQEPKSLAQDPPKSASTSLPNPPRTLKHKAFSETCSWTLSDHRYHHRVRCYQEHRSS